MTLAGLLALVVAAVLPVSVANAQAASIDPAGDTPAGAIYKLPLDDARADAAPKRVPVKRAGTSKGSAAAKSSGASAPRTSALRSENNFGSSSIVPGTAAARSAAGDGDGAGAGAGEGGAGAKGAKDDSTGGSGSAAGDPSAAASDRRQATTGAAGLSSLWAYLFLGLVLAVGVAGGMATRVRRRGGSG